MAKVKDHINTILKLANDMPKIQVELKTVGISEMLGLMKNRIFKDGLDSSNNKIGSYSSKEATFSPSRFFKKKPAKAMKFDNGYKGLREYLGRQTNFVDLNFSGSLKDAVKSFRKGDNFYISIMDNSNDTTSEVLKAEGNEDRFNKTIFESTEKERKAAQEIVSNQISEILKRYFK